MKELNYYGMRILVRNWAKYVAMDKDRHVYGYDTEPHINEATECWLPPYKGKHYFIYEPALLSVLGISWKLSLVEV